MVATLLLCSILMAFQSPAGASPASAPQTQGSGPQQPAVAKIVEPEPVLDKSKALIKVRRIYVDSFGTSEAALQLQAMVVASLTDSKLFTVTEDKTKADAILKGFATEKSSQELHAYGSSTSVATASGGHSGSISGSNGTISGSSSGGFGAAAAGIDDSSVNTETIDRANASVRLINADGDVVWTSTQESKGAKYKGASADVADKIVKQLLRDVEKAQRSASNTATK